MRRALSLCLAALATLAGCAHAPRAAAVDAGLEARKCELVRTLLGAPVPGRLLSELATAADGEGPVPVRVFVAKPEQGWLDRLFAGEPLCQGARFRVVQESADEALVLLLQPAADGGYHFDARRAGPQELWLAGPHQGHVAPRDGGWALGGS